MDKVFRHNDVVAGGAAAALLVLLVLVNVTPWVSVLLAVAVYVGIVLLRPQDRPDTLMDEHRHAYESGLAHLASIRALTPQVVKPDVRDRVRRMANRAEQVLAVMEEDRLLAAATPFNNHLLEPFDVLLAEYVRLSNRGVKGAERLLEKAESHDLPMIESAVDSFYEKLHRGTIVDLATHGELLELNIESLNLLSLRRATS